MNLQNCTALVHDYGLFISSAMKLRESFGRVLYYCPWKSAFPKSNLTMIGDNIPGIERVLNFWDVLKNEDTDPDKFVFVFFDTYDGDLQVYLRSIGKRVWGGGKGEELELFRMETKNFLKKLGLPVQPVREITGTARLREYLKDKENKWIKISTTRGDGETWHFDNIRLSEPKLDEIDYKLGAKKSAMKFVVEDAIDDAIEVGYDGFCIDGKFPATAMQGFEIKDQGLIGVVKPYADFPKPVRLVNSRLAPILEKYQYRNMFSTEIRIGKDNLPYLIDPCFSEDTEILTNHGWKFFYDLLPDDDVCTMNVETRAIEYQRPYDYIKNHFKGEMVLISNKEKGIECLVTPNHNIWRTDRHGNGLFTERSDSLTDKGYIPRTAAWSGESPEFFTLPAYNHTWMSGRSGTIFKEKICPALQIPMKDWLWFLGLYLSEGSRHSRWAVNITQTTYRDGMRAILKKLPFNVTDSDKGLVIHSVQLAKHVEDLGYSSTKRVPEYVKRLSSELIEEFLAAYRLGDGRLRNGQSTFQTTSVKMADDIQELVLRVGRCASIRTIQHAGSEMSVKGGKIYKRRFDLLEIADLPRQNRFWFEAAGVRKEKYISRVPYNGPVYDVTVPNHTVYVRRNGKPFWSSNCPRQASPPGELYQELYSNWGEIIWHGAAGELVEPKPLGKYGVEVMIHSAWADKNWQPIYVPKEVFKWVKLRNLTRLGDTWYVIPQEVGLPEIGAVVAYDDTILGAIAKVKKYASQVEGYQIEIKMDSITTALEAIRKSEEMGMHFADEPVPTCEEIAKALAD